MDVVDRLLGRHAGHEAALLRRSEDEHAATEVVAQPGEFPEVVHRAAADVGVGMGHVEALCLRQQPVKPHAVKTRPGDRPADLAASRSRQVGRERREGEGGDLDARVAAGGGDVAGLRQRPIAEGLVADRVANGGVHH